MGLTPAVAACGGCHPLGCRLHAPPYPHLAPTACCQHGRRECRMRAQRLHRGQVAGEFIGLVGSLEPTPSYNGPLCKLSI